MLSMQASNATNTTPTAPQAPASLGVVPPSPRVGAQGEGLDHWFEELRKHEATLSAMAAASADPKFREELGTIEQWFKLLSESEQTATLYTLLQHANPGQVKFLAAIIGQMSDSVNPPAADAATKAKPGPKSLRPPSLNLPLPGSPATPGFSITPVPPQEKADGQDLVVKSETSWANEVSTPMVKMFSKGSESGQNAAAPQGMPGIGGMAANAGMGMPGVPPMLNPFNVAMLNNMGFSNEAQLLAVQMIMNGMVPGQMPAQQGQGHRQGHHNKPSGNNNNWRSPASAKYPGSALRSGFKTSGLKSAGLKTAGLKSAGLGSATTPKEEDIDPEMLKDVPLWLKSLRLHKYTHCFEGMTWKDMVVLDEETLEKKGVAALGARRRLLKTFDAVKRKMGMETGPVDTVPASAVLPSTTSILPRASTDDLPQVPHSALH